MNATATRPDVYATVTNKITAAMEQGIQPWFCPWNARHAAGSISRPLRHNGQPYSGVNVIQLWATGFERGYSSPLWLTFNQAREMDAFVRKGEKGSLVVYASTFTKKKNDEKTGEEIEEQIPFMKGYTVFNSEQIDGLPDHFYALAEQPKNLAERLESAERFYAATRADIKHGGNRAFYSLDTDYVQMPPYECFRDRESYYATLSHEMAHWTRHQSRLDRDLGRKRFGDEGYAMEELVAELSSAFLSADLGITAEPRADHAGYLQSWLKVLKNDKKAIFSAAAMAEKAVAYLHGLQPHANMVS